MDSNIAILVTGKIEKRITESLFESYSNIDNKILSTWDTEDKEYIKEFEENGFQIVLTTPPHTNTTTVNGTMMQLIPIASGVKYAKERGYEYLMRSRTDIVSSDFLKYLDKTKHLYKDKLTALAFNTKYIFEVFICGKIDEMVKFYKVPHETDMRPPEEFLSEEYIGILPVKDEDIRQKITETYNICKENSMQFYWLRERRMQYHLKETISPYVRLIGTSEGCSSFLGPVIEKILAHPVSAVAGEMSPHPQEL
jgi:hypothetical protein